MYIREGKTRYGGVGNGERGKVIVRYRTSVAIKRKCME